MKEQKIKILWISSHAPYSSAPDAGGQTFNYYFNKIAHDPRFEVVLLSLGNDKKKDEIMRELDGIQCHLLSSTGSFLEKIKKIKNIDYKLNPWNKYANLISNYYGDRFLDEVKKLKKNGYIPTIIIFEWTNTLILASKIKKIYKHSKFVASEHDVTFVGYKRKAEYFKGFKKIHWHIKYRNEKKIETSALKLCDLVLPQNWDNRMLLVAEGIPEEKIQWLIPFFNNMIECPRKVNGKDILFFGAMARPENYLSAIWFIENVMPLINDMDIRFVVLGSNPPEKLKQYENSRIHITGFVDSVIPYFEQSVCLVAPLVLGAGIKVKIIEALSSGIPVITNDIGIEGIPAENGKEYLHCQTPEEFEKAIRLVFSNENLCKQLQNNAKNFIKNNYSINQSVNEYMDKLQVLGDQL